MFNIVELKQERKAKRDEYKSIAAIAQTRDLTPEEADRLGKVEGDIASLTGRIEVLEKAEVGEEEAPVEEGRSFNHLNFKVSTSKTRKESGEYSLNRALSLAASGKKVDGIEGEHSEELSRGKVDIQGFRMPLDFKVRGRHRMQTRTDFTTTSGTGAVGINVQPTFIELLRNRMVTDELGITVMSNCVGKFALPRQSGAATFTYIGEGSSGSNTTSTFDQVNFVPKTATCSVAVSRKNIFLSSIDAEAATEADMAKVMAIGLDTTVLVGDPSVVTASPTGILINSGVTTLPPAADSANGGALAYSDLIAFETALAAANADRGTMKFAVTPKIRGKLKNTPKIGSTFPEYLWGSDNTLNGYDALSTNELPSNLVKGSSGAVCSALIFGNWEDCVLALWSGVDVLVDPYTQGNQGAIIYRLFQEVDVQVRHPESFVRSLSVLTV